MSTHNICFLREIRKILCGYPLLSVAMEDGVAMFTSLVRARELFPRSQIQILMVVSIDTS